MRANAFKSFFMLRHIIQCIHKRNRVVHTEEIKYIINKSKKLVDVGFYFSTLFRMVLVYVIKLSTDYLNGMLKKLKLYINLICIITHTII